MSEKEPALPDQILDLLLDALLERQQARRKDARPVLPVAPAPPPAEAAPPSSAATRPKPEPPPSPEVEAKPVPKPAAAPSPKPELPEPLPSVNLGRMLGRLAIVMALLLVVVNIPFNRFGTSLARAMPDSAALVIRDGLLLKGSGERVYELQDNKLRWITSLDAFEQFGFRWERVHVVEDSFLDQFEKGQPIYLLLKCANSPHIYALEDGVKRWIEDIPTFEAEGFVWEDVRFVTCGYLRSLPDGVPIPADAGPIPQP